MDKKIPSKNSDKIKHSSSCLLLGLLVQHSFYETKFLDFTCMFIGGKTFYHPKFQF
jgi:hypothetical protein